MSMSQRTREQVATYLAGRVPFARASLSAEKYGPFRKGQLPDAEYTKLLRDEPTYIVYSYETPIAWVTSDNTSYVPDVRYSVTTSGHQRIVQEHL